MSFLPFSPLFMLFFAIFRKEQPRSRTKGIAVVLFLWYNNLIKRKESVCKWYGRK